jgi:hypothetical protein
VIGTLVKQRACDRCSEAHSRLLRWRSRAFQPAFNKIATALDRDQSAEDRPDAFGWQFSVSPLRHCLAFTHHTFTVAIMAALAVLPGT